MWFLECLQNKHNSTCVWGCGADGGLGDHFREIQPRWVISKTDLTIISAHGNIFKLYANYAFTILLLWPPDDVKRRLIGKDPNAGKDWGQEEKGATEDEMVGWYHWLNGHEFEQTLRESEGQGSLACCSPWGCKKSDMTEGLSNNKILWTQTISFTSYHERIQEYAGHFFVTLHMWN